MNTLVFEAGESPQTTYRPFLRWIEDHGWNPRDVYKIELHITELEVTAFTYCTAGGNKHLRLRCPLGLHDPDSIEEDVCRAKPLTVTIKRPMPVHPKLASLAVTLDDRTVEL